MPVVTRLTQNGTLQSSEFDEISTNIVRFNSSGVVFSTEFCEVWTGINTISNPVMQPYNVLNDTLGETPYTYSKLLTSGIVYTPYSLLIGDFLGDFSINDYKPPINTTLMRQMMTSDIVVYNEIDEVTTL